MKLRMDWHEPWKIRSPRGAARPGLSLAAGAPHWREWPQTEDYFSPIKLLFTSSLKRISEAESRPGWIVRDGSQSLARFFKKFKPSAISKSEFLVHESLADKVPPSWRSHCRSFRPVSFTSEPLDGLLLCGINDRNLIDPQLLQLRIDLALKALSRRCQRVYVVMPSRRLETSSEAHEVHERVKTIVSKAIKGSIRINFINWQGVEEIPSMDRLALVELNQPRRIGDPYMTHFFMAKGARLIYKSEDDGTESSEILPLSLNHGFLIKALSLKTRKRDKVANEKTFSQVTKKSFKKVIKKSSDQKTSRQKTSQSTSKSDGKNAKKS